MRLTENHVTDENLYLNRRQFVKGMTATGLIGIPFIANALDFSKNQNYQEKLKLTDPEHALHYNNFYELGTSKEDPFRNADKLKTDGWQVVIEGECAKPQTFDMDDLLKLEQEERIYRFRCVEGWSMVVPWIGFPLSKLLSKVEPNSKAKYVEFISIEDPNLPGQRFRVLDWPYREGLRMDEAMHPLTFMATGIYGESLPNQNGAPIRLVVPWKYGFKSSKSIVKIRLVEKQPLSSWMVATPSEYGFYSNVNPNVSHPRWSQAKERPLGSFFKKKTLMFNGYENEVASLYKGMDLKKNF
ncbi:protein-methionine-sulfoxide reductase catalytic subunit MsrP [Thiomicrorhabdus lithotrophica]|uniref:Protein-methionine-sulfoxide reductase catalytic subunit MsrP n=1 Tax=Thiomicrorhabdus lithotrophica TaxID=2949997 RepID=A0ABY8CAR8_9GAMM|nr:protein-methionine-sulfoxide reductase catalytic subunit MsrP [Thiomicrorhabdus lithotrophica]WEJ63066.1 protein-methionine-sulfoxide reductase catalytic subunit MsrP [Thiomicrorhabdus lithotrophica]